MYYQIYNQKDGKTFLTCPDFESAMQMLKDLQNPSYRDGNLPVYAIRPIKKSDHPLAGRMEPNFTAAKN